jgi:aspartyl-tRNA(Asn)/glutamyl-tRNA(Gln) amidotransferase subunit B
MKYKPVMGLEVHVELKTKSKMFCGCSADYFGQKPNTHTCPVCLGLPGALPVANQKAIDWCVMIGQALNCKIANFSKFDRKNYFYPDLAKGYQISQYDQPFCQNGFMMLSNGKKLGITRVHMEEDTGKLTHQGDSSLIDFNRSGVPLVEIVTEPEFENAKEVVEYLKRLQQIVRYLNVSKADMEEGNMRLEPNISLRRERETGLPKYKVEVKNINSFRFVEKAIEFEIKRQAEILDTGNLPVQETRGWNETKNKTVSQRVKEEANDYRYFPEPDIPPVILSDSRIAELKSQTPETPKAKFERFKKEFNLLDYDVEILTREKSIADYFEEAVKIGSKHKLSPKQIANQLINRNIDINSVLPAKLIEAILSSTQTTQIDEKKLEGIIDDVLKKNQKAVLDYKSGKENAIMFLVGQTLKTAKQKLDTNILKEKLESILSQ